METTKQSFQAARFWRLCLFLVSLLGLTAIGDLGCSDVLGPGYEENDGGTATVVEKVSAPEPSQRSEPVAQPDKSQPPERSGPEGSTKETNSTKEPTPSSAYGYKPPPSQTVPLVLQGDTWLKHWQEDIQPFWTSAEALGSPIGNFPTERSMDGQPSGNTDRRPRMLARQTYTYAMGYLMTGDSKLLQYALQGCDWLIAKAYDKARGGWHALLDEQGNPKGSESKWAQDTAYSLMGPGVCYFLTRQTKYEDVLLATHDKLFDPNIYWDNINQRIQDGRTPDLSQEADSQGDGGWELVAQLDPLNAYMLLVQPVLSSSTRRTQFLSQMKKLCDALLQHFFADGIFWGVHNKKRQYKTRHVDFGHTLKSYWMLLQVDKRLPDHPYHSFVKSNVYKWTELAYDSQHGSWANRMTSQTSVDYGSGWWTYAESDQITATLNLLDYRYLDRLAKTSSFWLNHYIDKQNKGIYDGVKRDGSGWDWPLSSNSKCNAWKNGYHATEHALLLYMFGRQLERKTVSLYFAIPASQVPSFVARPYIFQGTEVSRQEMGDAGNGLRKVKVTFDKLY